MGAHNKEWLLVRRILNTYFPKRLEENLFDPFWMADADFIRRDADEGSCNEKQS